MAFVLCLIVLAITYNQGAARPASSDLELITKNELTGSSELSPRISDDGVVFRVPRSIREGLVITIKGTLNTNETSFTVVLPSTSGSEDCEIKYSFQNHTITMSPADSDYNHSTDYSMNLPSPEDRTRPYIKPTFTLNLRAKVKEGGGGDRLGMVFNGNEEGESSHLVCKIKNFQDINQIVMKEGVADIHSLMFEFEQNH